MHNKQTTVKLPPKDLIVCLRARLDGAIAITRHRGRSTSEFGPADDYSGGSDADGDVWECVAARVGPRAV